MGKQIFIIAIGGKTEAERKEERGKERKGEKKKLLVEILLPANDQGSLH